MDYMLSIDEKTIANEWRKYEGYTVRPLPSTMEYYGKLVSKYAKEDRALIYGGTPEIRSVFQALNLSAHLVDRSEKMVRSLGYLTTHQKPLSEKETFIEDNWLELKNINNDSHDFLIGDDAINMVHWESFNKFLFHANRVLQKDGIFVCHLLVKPDDCFINMSFSTLVSDYHDGAIKSKFDLASQLNFLCFDKESFEMGWQKTIETIGGDKFDIFKPEFDFVETFQFCNSKFYCPPQLMFEKLVADYFEIVELFYPNEHDYCLFEPVYVLKKK